MVDMNFTELYLLRPIAVPDGEKSIREWSGSVEKYFWKCEVRCIYFFLTEENPTAREDSRRLANSADGLSVLRPSRTINRSSLVGCQILVHHSPSALKSGTKDKLKVLRNWSLRYVFCFIRRRRSLNISFTHLARICQWRRLVKAHLTAFSRHCTSSLWPFHGPSGSVNPSGAPREPPLPRKSLNGIAVRRLIAQRCTDKSIIPSTPHDSTWDSAHEAFRCAAMNW